MKKNIPMDIFPEGNHPGHFSFFIVIIKMNIYVHF